jgi:hypothetical protein
MEKEQNATSSQVSKALDGDAHAMRTLLNSNQKERGEISELSSLFSTQIHKAATDLKKPGTDWELEKRLKQYQEAKDNTKTKQREEENSRQDHGQGQNQDNDPPHKSLEEIAREVAEHILVSDKEHMDSGSDQEVRIKIKDSILKDAHVHMVNRHGCLEVKLISSDEQSIQTLVATRDSLEKQLKKNHGGLIRIRIVQLKPEI